mmetsp:Transcript_11723/g.17970  ORF Transcript_11723/g.17970 Transcript_11723/m.17970 type:complete len:112 (+) Transcript_11723:148-483(+)
MAFFTTPQSGDNDAYKGRGIKDKLHCEVPNLREKSHFTEILHSSKEVSKRSANCTPIHHCQTLPLASVISLDPKESTPKCTLQKCCANKNGNPELKPLNNEKSMKKVLPAL